MKDNMLEVGDVLYIRRSGKFIHKETITRVTAKRAYVHINGDFEREYYRLLDNMGQARRYNQDSYITTSAFLENDDLKARWQESIDRNDLAKLLEVHSTWPIGKVREVLALLQKS